MSADAIREAMALAAALAAMPRGASFGDQPSNTELLRALSMIDAALAALPVTAAQLAEIAAGRAVVVPMEATEGMARAGGDVLDCGAVAGIKHEEWLPDDAAEAVFRAMIAAAPKAAP